MKAGWRIAINSLSAKWARSALLAIAVACSAAFVVAVSSSLATVTASLQAAMYDMLGRADLRLRHQAQGRVDASLLELVETWPEIALAAPRLVEPVEVRNTRTNSEAILNGVGVDFTREWHAHPVEILQGRLPAAEEEAIVDPKSADTLGIQLGDVIEVGDRYGTRRRVTVVGVHERMALAILQKPEIRLALPVLQETARRADALSSIDIVLEAGDDAERVVEQRRSALPDMVELSPSELMASGLDRQVNAMRIANYVAAMLSFLAAMFIVLTGMTTAVTEQIRELAILRCIGAARRQLFAVQLLSGGIIGALGGVLGAPLGLALAWVLVESQSEILRVGLQVPWRVPATGIGVAVMSGFIGAAAPALSSTRISPLEALRIRSRIPEPRGLIAVFAVSVAAIALGSIALRSPDDRQLAFWLYVTIGLPSLIVGWFLIAAPVTSLVAHAVAGAFAMLIRTPRDMLRRSIIATPYRHGFTAGAMMLGFAMMIALWTVGEGLLTGWVSRIRFPDAFIVNYRGFELEDLQTLKSISFVGDACPIGHFTVEVEKQIFGLEGVAPRRVFFVSFDPEPFFRMTRLEWAEGDRDTALGRLQEGGAVLVAREFLRARGIGVGDFLTLGPENNQQEFEVVGVVSSPGLDIATSVFGIEGQFQEQALHCVFGSRADAIRLFDQPDMKLIQFDLVEDVTYEQAELTLKRRLGAVQYGSGQWIKETLTDLSRDFMAVASVIAIAAMVVASFGMANVVAANVAARRYEYGVLRAIGASRAVIARLVLGEGVIVAISACIVGAGMGLQVAWNEARLYRILLGIDVAVVPPRWPLVIGSIALIALAMMASAAPLWNLLRRRPRELLFGAGAAA